MFNVTPLFSSSLLLLGISGAAAKLGNFNTVGDVHDTIDEVCAATNLPKYSKVAKLCKELGTNGLDISLDDTVLFRGKAPDGLAGYKGPNFNMREILEAEDVEATYNEIEARYQQQTERKLLVDYGWCSTSARFVTKLTKVDSSRYCDDSQTCDSSIGCGSELSSCCIKHDKCLQAPSLGNTKKCNKANCKGSTCDKHLSKCAWNVSCCSRSWFRISCDWSCISYSTLTAVVMGGIGNIYPNIGHNNGGDDSDSVCSE